MDSLDDVQLDVALVSDEPNTWIVPSSLVRAWDANHELNAEEAFFGWWEHLRFTEQRIHETFGPTRSAELKDLLVQYDSLRHGGDDYRDIPDEQRELRRVVVRMVRMDLTTEQVAKILCVSRETVVHTIAWNRPKTKHEAHTRIAAEDLLRAGKRYADVSREVGIPEWVVRRWGATLGIPAREGGFGQAPRERALALHDEGVKVAGIVEILNAEFPDVAVKRMTVYKWINRRKHQKVDDTCQE